MKLALATITSSYVLFLDLVSKGFNQRLFTEITKKNDEANFLNDVKNCDFSLKTDDPNKNYDFLTSLFTNIVNNHAPLKKKFMRVFQAPFMTRNPREEIYTRSRFRNKFCKNPTKEHEKLCKKQRNKCVALRRKCIKEYFPNITDNNIVINKTFWSFLKPFLINKGLLNSCKIMLRKESRIITDTKEIVQILNDHYINIVKRPCEEKRTSVAKKSYLTDDIKIVDHIIRHYEDHPSVRHIKKNVKTPQNSTCSLLAISEREVTKILKELSTEKSTGVDMMRSKLLKLAANYLARSPSQSISTSVKKGCFPKMQRLPQLLP